MALSIMQKIFTISPFKITRLGKQLNHALRFHGSASKLRKSCPGEEQFYTRLASKKDHEAVMCVMRDTYLKSEPSIVNVGLSGVDIPRLDYIILEGIKEGMTIVAVRHEDDAVVGAAINTGSCPWGPEKLLRYANNCECGTVQDLLKFYAYVSMQPQLWQKYCILKIFECTYVVVDSKCQGHGLGKRLIRDSWYFARDCGYRLFRIDCTSRYTAKIAKDFGWKCAWSFPYSDYILNGDRVFKEIQDPHTIVDVYVDQIRFCKDYCGPYPPCKKQNKNSTVP